ncbi:MAG: fimbrillin family protein [Bacteroidales bacterium]|nr:fimbrillin family protein [Bacteroidales bacterium]
MKTMKHTIAKYFAAAAALCLTAVGCSTLQEDKGVSENRDIRFSASIGSFQVKATDTAFENGDAIGLYAGDHVKAENVRLDWKDGALTPETPVQWGFNQLVDESTLFSAYYPYTAEPQIATDEGGLYLAFSVQKDQSTHAAYTASDLMTASTYATPAEGTVNFTFIHRLSKLVLTVDNRLNDPVKEVYVGNVYADGVFDIVHSQNYGSTGEPSSVKACEGVTAAGEKAWSVIIPSQSCLITLTLVTESGKEYTYKSEYNVYFAAARRYTAQVILDETAISTSFLANVYDWIDNGGFWFRQPNPLFEGQWALVGTLYGTAWDRDFNLQGSPEYLYTDVVLHAGDEFKFRKDGSWDINFGAADITAVGEKYNWVGYDISQGGQNFVVQEDGVYRVELYLENGRVFLGWQEDLPTPEGTPIWSGGVYMNDWNYEEAINSSFATEDVWVNNNLQVGDAINIYYNAFPYYDYWIFQVYDGHFALNNGTLFESYNYNFMTGHVTLNVDEQWYNALTNIQYWGSALVIMGQNVAITDITLVKPYRPAEGEWTIIGNIYGSSWDQDFQMTDQSAAGFPGCWSAVLDYNNGEEFKFRQSGTWDVNLGIDGGWTDTGNNTYSATMIPNGPNIMLPMEGQWTLMLNTVENTLSATYNAN